MTLKSATKQIAVRLLVGFSNSAQFSLGLRLRQTLQLLPCICIVGVDRFSKAYVSEHMQDVTTTQSCSLQAPDAQNFDSAPQQQPNGDSPIELHTTLSLAASPAHMDVDLQQDASDEALQVRLQRAEAERDQLARKLAKAQKNLSDVARLVALFNEKEAELERTKLECQQLIAASQETSQRDLDNVQRLLRETEKARMSADQHISEQSVLVSQLQSQLQAALNQQAMVDSQEAKKDLNKLRLDLEAKERALVKKEEKVAMQQLEIANLSQRVKTLERSLKQAGSADLTSNRSNHSLPSSIIATPSTSNLSSPAYDAPLPFTPETAPKKRATKSRSKRTTAASKRSGTESEEDEEMAESFMQAFGKELMTSSSDTDDPDFIVPISIVSSPSIPSEPRAARPQRTRTTKVTASASMDVDEEEEIREILNSTTAKKTAPQSRISVPTPSLTSSTSLMPPPVSSTPLRRTKPTSSSIPAPAAFPVSSPSIASNNSNKKPSTTFHPMELDLPSRTIVFQANYRLEPVALSWSPLSNKTAISNAVGELLSASQRGPPDSSSVSTLASKICCVKASTVVRAFMDAITLSFSPLVAEWSSGSMGEADMLEIVTEGPKWEETMIALILSYAHGSLVQSTTAIQIIERMMICIHRHIFCDKTTKQAELPDFSASCFVRLYTQLCREFGLLQRARDLLFDILREREEICMLQLMACIASWPLVVEASTTSAHSHIASLATSTTNSKSYVTCTIQCLLSAALGIEAGDSGLGSIQRELLKKYTGWTFGSDLSTRNGGGSLEKEQSALQSWTKFVIASFESCIETLKLETNPNAILRFYNVGSDLVRSMELLATQMGWTKCFQQIVQPIIGTRLSWLITLSSQQKMSPGIVIMARTLIKACAVLSRVGLDSGGNISPSTALIQQFLASGLGMDFSIQLEAVSALLELATSEISLDVCKAWFSSLPPIQRHCVPHQLQKVLK